MSYAQVRRVIRAHADKKRAESSARFFKTGKGEYGEGEKFLGLTMKEQRRIAKQYGALEESGIVRLLQSPWHEERMTGLLILVHQFQHGDELVRAHIFAFYLKHRKAINNWDLVDVTTPTIVGEHLLSQPAAARKFLYEYAQSASLWERRMAILATFAFIKAGDIADTFRIAELLLYDKEDLIHKAVGWMLREVGKQDKKELEQFLKKHSIYIPRTTLRYAIERFPEKERKAFLALGK